MKIRAISLCLAGVLALLGQGCNLPLRSSQPIVNHDPTEAALSPVQTAQMLRDPGQARDGVWSLLSNLGLGVDMDSGGQIVPG